MLGGGLSGVDKQRFDHMVSCNISFCNKLRSVKMLSGDADETRNTASETLFSCNPNIPSVGDPRLWVGNWSAGNWNYAVSADRSSITVKSTNDLTGEVETWSNCHLYGNKDPATVVCDWRKTICKVGGGSWTSGPNPRTLTVTSEYSCEKDEYHPEANTEITARSIAQPAKGTVKPAGRSGWIYTSNKDYKGPDSFVVSLKLKQDKPAFFPYAVTVMPDKVGSLEAILESNKITVTEWEKGTRLSPITLTRK